MAQKSEYFQVFNWSTGRWVKFSRLEGRVVDCKKTKGKYEGIPVWRQKKK